MQRTTIHWFRRDLRLEDNTAFIAAMQNTDFLLPVFVLDENLLKSTRVAGSPRLGFMVDCLRLLHQDLRARGSGLIIRQGNPAQVLSQLAADCDAARLTYNRDYTPYALRRDDNVTEALIKEGLEVESYQDMVLHEYDAVLKDDGTPFQVFTPYKKRWLALPKPLPQAIPSGEFPPLPTAMSSDPMPTAKDLGGTYAEKPITEAGAAAGQKQVQAFIQNGIVKDYDTARDELAEDGTAKISPHLRWGTISIRQCYDLIRDDLNSKGAQTWLSELAWREFYQMILAHHPHITTQNFRPQYDQLEWENNPDHFERWKTGKTGYPVVDAAMRQLNQSGWMHNRARMIVASFLCKDLLIDWRWGEKYFMQRLLDGDIAANNGGWQWTAGTGTDAAPYFRIFNPTKQGERHDPDGVYVRRWVPELATVPTKFIHQPWKMPPQDRRQIDYPERIVDHKTQRQKALDMYGAARDQK